jgi:hypothetical protein
MQGKKKVLSVQDVPVAAVKKLPKEPWLQREATAATTDVPVSNETPAADAAPEATEQQPS